MWLIECLHIVCVMFSMCIGVPIPSAVESKELQQFSIVRKVGIIKVLYQLLFSPILRQAMAYLLVLLCCRIALCFGSRIQ